MDILHKKQETIFKQFYESILCISYICKPYRHRRSEERKKPLMHNS